LKICSISLILVSLFVLFNSFTQSFNLKESIERGKDGYALYCQNCHMEDGNGQPAAVPTLLKADFLNKPARDLINVILIGQTGEIQANGITYNGIMPAQNYLTDNQIADILNYVRNSWGNTAAKAIIPNMVKGARP